MLSNTGQSVPVLNALSLYLREPRRRVESLLVKNTRLQSRLDFNRDHRLSIPHLQQLAQSFRISEPEAYCRLLADDSRSRIIAAFHLGDYVYGMNALLASVPHTGLVRVLSQRAACAEHWRNIERAFNGRVPGQEAELLVGDTTPAQLSALLRGRSNTLLLFCDLPVGNGVVTRVKFLGRDAWFPRGAATLAVMNRVPLLPVFCYTGGLYRNEQHLNEQHFNKQHFNERHFNEQRCNKPHFNRHQSEVFVLPQLECAPRVRQGESYTQCIQRITQALVMILEEVLICAPEQWRYLAYLPRYFSDPGAEFNPGSNFRSLYKTRFTPTSAARTQHAIYKESCYDIQISNGDRTSYGRSSCRISERPGAER